MLAKYIYAIHGYVQTLISLLQTFQVHLPILCRDNAVLQLWLGSGTKNTS